MVAIELTRGQVAVVDDEDADLAELNWCAHKTKPSKTFYAKRKNGSGYVYLHRVVARRIGLDAALNVDHIDRDGLNCTRRNLRAANKAQSVYNRGISVSNTSGAKGVFWDKRRSKWYARVKSNGRGRFLGYFSEIEPAVIAVTSARNILHGEYACHD